MLHISKMGHLQVNTYNTKTEFMQHKYNAGQYPNTLISTKKNYVALETTVAQQNYIHQAGSVVVH
jgi:hypothetical protein